MDDLIELTEHLKCMLRGAVETAVVKTRDDNSEVCFQTGVHKGKGKRVELSQWVGI